jgi:cysteine synthase
MQETKDSKDGGTIIEATSGNTELDLQGFAAVKAINYAGNARIDVR